MFPLGTVPAGSILYLPFDTYSSAGASVTITGLAVTDIEIYKNGSITQRASDNGYALLDTDGIDFDGSTGLHGFSIDLADNSDAGFYAAGATYWVHVNAITVDGQTVKFTYWFRLVAAESVAGTPKVDVSHFGGAVGTFASGRPEVNATHWAGTPVGSANVRADLRQVLGTAITEGAAGRLAAALSTLLDVAAPVLTAASVNQTGDSFARLGAPAGASVSADLLALTRVVEADLYIDKSGSPWDLVWMQRGTGAPGVGTELLRKNLADVDGGALASTSVVVGRMHQ